MYIIKHIIREERGRKQMYDTHECTALELEGRSFNEKILKLADCIAELQAQVVELKKLLKVAECPDGDCVNGAVGVWKGEHPDGTESWESYECQWCAERKAAIKGDKDANQA